MTASVDHLFVLMLENRSFDHVLGWRKDADGADPARKNLDLAGNAHFQTELQGPRANVFPYDPPHASHGVAEQIDGPDGAMSGFVQSFEKRHAQVQPAELQAGQVMQHLGEGALPVFDELGAQFAISDRWFSPLPTQTMPNRMYAMCGHSCGDRDNPSPANYFIGYGNDDSIFHKLQKRGLDWRVYNDNLAPLVALIRSLRDDLWLGGHNRSMRRFADDLQSANHHFPAFTWLEPTYTWAETFVLDPFFPEPNDDHPPSALERGQALVQYVFNALRQSPIWDRSALVITYDEHGGFYDHVPPPACTAQADGFIRRGPRVPALIVSPHVRAGSVVRPSSVAQVFDHTSILKFLCERHGIAPWTDRLRDPSTASLGDVFESAQLPASSPASIARVPLKPEVSLDERAHRAANTMTEGMRLLTSELRIAQELTSIPSR